jgi:hypothetical protein
MALDEHGGPVHPVAFSPNGKILAAGGQDFRGKSPQLTLWYGEGVPAEPGP